jgi:hypothetical protein
VLYGSSILGLSFSLTSLNIPVAIKSRIFEIGIVRCRYLRIRRDYAEAFENSDFVNRRTTASEKCDSPLWVDYGNSRSDRVPWQKTGANIVATGVQLPVSRSAAAIDFAVWVG